MEDLLSLSTGYKDLKDKTDKSREKYKNLNIEIAVNERLRKYFSDKVVYDKVIDKFLYIINMLSYDEIISKTDSGDKAIQTFGKIFKSAGGYDMTELEEFLNFVA